MSEFSRETLLNIIETDHVQCGEASALARMALAAMDSEPVAYISKSDFNAGYPHILARRDFNKACTMAVYAAQPAPVVPENCVTAEHRRVIEMLLNVCGAAFELADDSCQQDVDGEDCHVVPDDAFQKLSDALDEIENTLPTEDIDRPDVFLAWSAMPRAALKSLLQAQPAPVVDADDNFYSWFGREWAENYQHNQYTTAAKQMLGVMAESAWKAATERQRQKQNVSVPDVKMYEDVPYEVGRLKTHRDCYCDGCNACRAAMLAAAPQSPGSEPAAVPGKWIPVSERMPDENAEQQVLACFKGGDISTLYYFEGRWDDAYGIVPIRQDVTHWMPLPAAPQEVNHG